MFNSIKLEQLLFQTKILNDISLGWHWDLWVGTDLLKIYVGSAEHDFNTFEKAFDQD